MRNNVKPITFNGQTHSITEWSRLTGIRYSTLQKRLEEGWPPEAALTYPRSKRFNKKNISPLGIELLDYQRDFHARHRQFQRSIRTFIGDIEKQIAELRRNLDHMVDEQINSQGSKATPGVVVNCIEGASDRSLPSTQDSV